MLRRFALCLCVSLSLLKVAASAVTAVSITDASINTSTNQITIQGSGFDPSGVAPTVSFKGVNLPVVSFTNTTVVATLPAQLAAATYRFVVTNSTGGSYIFGVTYGAIGPQGPAGPQGPTGATGPEGPAGPQEPMGASPWGLNGSNTYYTAGNVGVGTTTPAAPPKGCEARGSSQFQLALKREFPIKRATTQVECGDDGLPPSPHISVTCQASSAGDVIVN
jgi:hypothetical protein